MYETVHVQLRCIYVSVLDVHCTVFRQFPIAIGGLILYSTSCAVGWGGGGGGGDVWVVPRYRV